MLMVLVECVARWRSGKVSDQDRCQVKGKGNCIAVMEHHVTATECHLPVLLSTQHK